MGKIWDMAKDQKRAMREAKGTQDVTNWSQMQIRISDEKLNQPYFVYIYNILNLEYRIAAPPHFPSFHIPACAPDEKFAWNKIGAFLLEAYEKPGTFEINYTKIDGRRVATSLLNPSAYPGTQFESQLQIWDSPDQYNNNLNAFGVFWSLTEPGSPKLEEEIALFRSVAEKNMNNLIRQAETLAAANDQKSITPMMHFAMDYFQKQAPWHMAAEHRTSCPNCGESVKAGIAYHRNSFGEKCIIDADKYRAMLAKQRAVEEQVLGPAVTEAEEPVPTRKPAGRKPTQARP